MNRAPDPAVYAVLVTGPDAATLEAMGWTLVNERLIACANVLSGVTSVYRWEGEMRADAEALAILKTTEDRLEDLRLRVASLHPYDVPEFVALPVARGAPEYLSWVRESIEEGDADDEA